MNKSYVGPNLPPGPAKLPIIGSLHRMLGRGLPHHRLRDLARAYGPLMHLQLGEISTIVVTSSQLAKEFMQTHDLNFASRPSIPSANVIFYDGRDVAFAAYGAYWKQMRKIFAQELLLPRRQERVDSMRLVMEEEVRQLRTKSTTAPLNLSRMLVSLSTAITYRTAFGKFPSQQDQGAFLAALQQILVVLGGFSPCDVFPSSKLLRVVSGTQAKLKKLHRETDVIMEAIINDHKAKRLPGNCCDDRRNQDLVDVLLNFSQDHALGFPITNTEIKAVILDIFLAGSETTSGTLNWAMSELMRNPRAMKKAQIEKLVVKETLRLHHPPLAGPREARETMVIGGYQIPAKSRVVINSWALGRDPRYWTEPDKFYPERFLDSPIDYKGSNFELIPFGAGRRICPGLQFGVTLVNLALANLLYHFDWKLPDDMKPRDMDMTEEFSLASKKKNNLFVVPVPYYP
ncbi:unnamed protein product [Linum tenue]|uniref:Cytochrome P450 n=1 Tax=Linum tenue TaxID=586396 RepID=A0AAV0L845_9ROSI|nr:unnamed protein product [Linum tenue]